MSAEINNREYRQHVLKDMIFQLHMGKSVAEVQPQFAAVFGNVSAEEIALAEAALIEGGLSVAEVQRLCDVHAAVFKGSIDEIHGSAKFTDTPGHPASLLKQENHAIAALVLQIEQKLAQLSEQNDLNDLTALLTKLTEIDKHYTKKENLFFPYLEQYGISAPPKVMWGVDDEIRAQLKAVLTAAHAADMRQIEELLAPLLSKISEMIFKEENILLPMLQENLTQEQWQIIANESHALGYCLIDNVPLWRPQAPSLDSLSLPKHNFAKPVDAVDTIKLPTGVLKTHELVHMLNTLPLDITFVGKDDTVKYFSEASERIFPRTRAIIGREVSNCHPPASVHIVNQLVEDFKSGKKDSEDFWIRMGEKYILIRYFAVRDEKGEYLGVLEATQNIRQIQEISGEKRLVAPDDTH